MVKVKIVKQIMFITLLFITGCIKNKPNNVEFFKICEEKTFFEKTKCVYSGIISKKNE